MSDLRAAFDRGASKYDVLVGLNPGYHRHLNSAAEELVNRVGRRLANMRLLDLACGSGASTKALLRAAPDAEILGVDLSDGMLAEARTKQWPATVRFQQGRVGELDLGDIGEASWDGVFASYLFRNLPAEKLHNLDLNGPNPPKKGSEPRRDPNCEVSARDQGIQEIFELLKPGGWLVTQEYSIAGNRAASAVWDAVSWGVIIPLGAVVDRNPGLYRYLRHSVHDFDSTHEFMDRLASGGFVDVAVRTVPGWQHGILHTFVARKPVP